MSAYIHPLSDVQSPFIGTETKIWQFCVVLPKAKIGKNCNVCAGCFIENNVVVGDNVTIKNGVYLWDNIEIEDNVFIGSGVTFVNDLYPRSKQYPEKFEKIIIKRGASIGANSTILGGVTIGENAMIGAGSMIASDVPENSVFYGPKASFKKTLK